VPPEDMKELLAGLKKNFPSTHILVSGSALREYENERLPAGFTYLRNVEETVKFLGEQKNRENAL
jgi:hypothetical protein